MKRINMIGVSLIAVFAFSAVAVASASALVKEVLFNSATATFKAKNLPSPKNVAKLTIPSTGNTLECTGTSGGGAGTDKHLGSITIEFTGCSAELFGVKGECHSLGAGEKPGVISLKGTYHLGLGTDTTPPNPAILVLVPEFEFKCTILGISKGIKVRGSVMGLLAEATPGKLPLKSLPTEYEKVELTFATTGTGTAQKQLDTKFSLSLTGTPAKETIDTAALEASEEGGAFVPLVQQSETELLEYNTANKKIGLELEEK